MEIYSAMARYYDELFPLEPESIHFINDFITDNDLLQSKIQNNSGPCALPTLPDHSSEPVNILDTGCATGKLTIGLAELGLHVSGIDLNGDMIHRAYQKAEDNDLTGLAEFSQGNILDIEKKYKHMKFTGIVCFGNTLPHILHSKDRIKFFKAANNLLIPGGIFLVQILNYDKILSEQKKTLPDIETEHCIFKRKYKFSEDTDNIEFFTSLTIRSSGETASGSVPLYPIRKEILSYELKQGGFLCASYFKNYARAPYDKEQSDILLCAGSSQT